MTFGPEVVFMYPWCILGIDDIFLGIDNIFLGIDDIFSGIDNIFLGIDDTYGLWSPQFLHRGGDAGGRGLGTNINIVLWLICYYNNALLQRYVIITICYYN